MLAGEETRKQCSSLVRRTKRGRSENSGCKTVFQTQTQGSVRAKSDHTISHCLCPPPSELRQRRGEAEADDETMIWREREVDHGDPAPDCQPCAPLPPILPLLLFPLFLSLSLSPRFSRVSGCSSRSISRACRPSDCVADRGRKDEEGREEGDPA